MKKIIAMVLVLTMLLALTACGGAAETSTKLRVAMECGYAPYNWTQPTDENGAVQISASSDYAYGYDVMMAKKIAESMGRELEIIKLDWDSLVPAAQSGDVDLVIAGQSITAKRSQVVDFSDPYYYASIVTLVKSNSKYATATGLSGLEGGKCTSQLGTIWYDICLPQVKNANILPAQESAPAMLLALEAGAVDFVATDMPTAMAALVAYPDLKLLDFSNGADNYQVSEEEINLGISMMKDSTELKNAVNKVLGSMTKEDFETMMNEAIAVQPLS